MVSWSSSWIGPCDQPAVPGGAKSDPIDAERAARDALARTRLAQPKTGSERAALQARLTARRAAVEASATAQRQLHGLGDHQSRGGAGPVPRPEHPDHVTTATRLRPTTSADVEVFTCLSVLRNLARRVRLLEAEAAEHEKAIRTIVRSWRPDLLQLTGVGPIVAATVLTATHHLKSHNPLGRHWRHARPPDSRCTRHPATAPHLQHTRLIHM
ncbi:hypothetical protein [Micromonospora sp. M71_S20]|uniref:hypothetical protein n=1 Tax=Micromonospora sp. M71_S20 TaxID=592872 RepID=UPI0018F5951A|nr:hypothetical protein [Micromonospora sp. M71_S20]